MTKLRSEATVHSCTFEKVVLKSFASHKKTPTVELVFIKIADFHTTSLIKRGFSKFSSVNFAKFFRTGFFQNNSEHLQLSKICGLVPEKTLEKFQ